MAQVAIDIARQVGAQTIVHTAEPHQNSFNRFNVSIALLAPELRIASPFLDSRVAREAKRAAIERNGVRLAEPVHSVDANLWCRVIENGSLDDSTSRVPESVFTWSRMTNPGDEQTVRLRFSQGLPVALDGRSLSLAELVHELNGLAGAHGIGRFDGFEGTPWTAKNREVREAPAAAVILAAVRSLRQVALTDDEVELLDSCAARWIRAAVAGHWFTTVTQTLGAAIERLTRAVSGDVTVVLRSGAAFVSAVHPTHSLALDRYPIDLAAPLSYHRLLMSQVGADLLRNSH
jgi:argininosuccinate synthase